MAEDKRITKTKRGLRNTVIRLIESETFEKITVKTICQEAHVSRLTFYSYYRDKYDLMDDIFNYYKGVILQEHQILDEKTNREQDNVLSLCNLLKVIIDFFYDNEKLVFSVNYERNPYVKFSFHTFVRNCCDKIISEKVRQERLRHPLNLTSVFLCSGVSAYLGECIYGGYTREQTQASAHELLYGLLHSDIFLK
ncbi:MAG: TetR/AcrR family transcriptional regulator [Clostridia bacterium]|nr:TetR/AcrR family transcriptional regulator [Clostridia bacterium]